MDSNKMKHPKEIINELAHAIIDVYHEMNKKGLIDETTTFEEMADYAGKHVLLTEIKDEK